LWLAPFRLGERESGTDNEEAVAAYREALKENTRERVCTPHIAAIAALAGCSRTSVKNPLRQPRLLSLVLVKERRIPAYRVSRTSSRLPRRKGSAG
jgi:hypothetical protein